MKKLLFLILFFVTVQAQTTSEVGIGLIKHYETFQSHPYRCPAGVLTIGYGSTTNVRNGMQVTEKQAEALLRSDLVRFEDHIRAKVYRPLKWHEFDALSSFTFNVGYQIKGILQELINRGQTASVVAQIKQHNHAKVDGTYVVLKGLTKRRITETNLYKTGQLKY